MQQKVRLNLFDVGKFVLTRDVLHGIKQKKATLTVRSLKSLAALGFSGGCFKDGCVVIPIPSLGFQLGNSSSATGPF